MNYSTNPDFYQALVAALQTAKAITPSCEHARLRAGAELACDGYVVQHHDGTCTVQSRTTPGTIYVVAHYACTCQDYVNRQKRCKHLWAARFYVQARRGSLPADWQTGMHSEAVRDAKAEAGELVARVCSPEHGQQRNGGQYCVTAGR